MPIPVAARSNTSVCGLSLAGIAGSNPAGGRGGYGCLSVVNIVCCRIKISATGRSLVQRSLTECDVSECDLETPTMKRPRSELGCCATRKAKQSKTKQKRNMCLHYIMCGYCTMLHTFETFLSTANLTKYEEDMLSNCVV